MPEPGVFDCIGPLPIQVSVLALVSTPLRLFVLAPLREALPARVVVPLPARSPPVHVNEPLSVADPPAEGCTPPAETVAAPETVNEPLGVRMPPSAIRAAAVQVPE